MSIDDEAGATEVWFGKHAGKRFDELPYSYRLWAVYSDDAQENQWHAEFRELHHRCLDEERPHLSIDNRPGNIVTKWSRKQPFSKVYQDKSWMRWCDRKLEGHSRWEFLDLTWRYEAWLEEHGRGPRPRQASNVRRDIGQKCGPWDDSDDPVPENDQYDLTDSFIDDSEQNVADDTDYVAPAEEDIGSEAAEDEAVSRSSGDVGTDELENEDEDPNHNLDSTAFELDNDDCDTGDSSPLRTLQGPRVLELHQGLHIREAKDLFNDDVVEVTPPLSQTSQSTSSIRYASHGPITPEAAAIVDPMHSSLERRRVRDEAGMSLSTSSSPHPHRRQKRRYGTASMVLSPADDNDDQDDDTPIVVLVERWRRAKQA